MRSVSWVAWAYFFEVDTCN